MRKTLLLHGVQHIAHIFEQTCSTCLLKGGHSDFHNVPLVWEHHIPALIDLIEGRGIQNTSLDEDGAFDVFCAVCGKDYRTLSLSNKLRGRCEVILRRIMKKCVAVGQHYLMSFKLPFLTYKSNIRELWVVPQVLIGSGSVLEVIHLVYIIG